MTLHWKRRVIPRWRASSDRSVVFGNDTRTVPLPKFLQDDATREKFDSALADFVASPSIGLAADAMRFATVDVLRPALEPVALFIVNEPRPLPVKLNQDARLIIEGIGSRSTEYNPDIGDMEALEATRRTQIAELRRRLTLYPKNALGWLDLARLRTTMGQNAAAERDVLVSLALAPHNRYVLRSASRFFLHTGDAERAARLLSKSPRTVLDPWLLASEISACAISGKGSRLIKRAVDILESGRFSAADTAELAGALAAEEAARGAGRKKAKRLYLQSLIAPNDNALAQAQWASKEIGLEDRIPDLWTDSVASAEAAMYRAIRLCDFHDGLTRAKSWHIQEPFASRPMVAASFMATIQSDFTAAAQYARIGLAADPRNDALLNNLAFALMCDHRVQEAVPLLLRVRRDAGTSGTQGNPQYLANIGFLAYLCGQNAIGARAYEEAIRRYEKTGRSEEAVLAHIFHAFAAKATDAQDHANLLRFAEAIAEKDGTLLTKLVAARFLSETPQADIAQVRAADAATRQWVHDQERNLLILS